MPIEFTKVPNAGSQVAMVSVHVIGTLEKQDYGVFGMRLDEMVRQHGKLRLSIELVDFQGWSPGTVWEDVKLAFKHYEDIERIAVIGESRWEKGMTVLAKPFTAADVRYFDVQERDVAEGWIREGMRLRSTKT